MLQTIRERTQGWIAGTIISIIILSFALWGIHSYFVGSADTNVAVVNGVDITKEQFTLAYERLRRQAQTQYGLPASSKDESTLKNTAIQALIDQEVLKQASLKQGFNVFSPQIDGYLQSMPEFQIDGQFSVHRFQEVLSTTLMSTGDFLDLIRTGLLIDQPRLGIILTSFSLPNEVNYTIGLVNQERHIAYMTIPLSYFLSKDMNVPTSAIEAYYEEHKNDFMTPEQVQVEYIELSLAELTKRFNPTDVMLRNFYNENINAYVKMDETSKDPKVQPFDAVKDKVREMYVHQHAEEKFAELRDKLADITYEHPDSLKLASETLLLPIQVSESFTINKPGKDISQFKRVRDTAFSHDVLNLQNNSDVIQLNPERVIVLRVKSHTSSTLVPLANLQKQITEKLKMKDAEIQAEKLANELKRQLAQGVSPQQLAAKYQFTWNNKGMIERYSKQVDTAILDTAFRMPNPEMIHKPLVYAVTRVPNGYTIVEVSAVKSGSLNDQKQRAVFAEQVQNSQGVLEYTLYKRSQMANSKIVVN